MKVFSCIADLNEYVTELVKNNEIKTGIVGTFTDGQKVVIKGKYKGKGFWNPWYIRWECKEMVRSPSNWGSLFNKGLVEVSEEVFDSLNFPKVR